MPEEEDSRTKTEKSNESSPQSMPVTFGSFLVGLASSALEHLGEIPDPALGQIKKDMLLARQTIDLLEILKVKTQGNLDHDEARLLDSLLYDLRLKYLAADGGS